MKNYEMMLTEFYDANSSNAVKLCMQEEFDKFGERDKCWVQCCYNLENSKNQYLLMFSLNIMEVKYLVFFFYLTTQYKAIYLYYTWMFDK